MKWTEEYCLRMANLEREVEKLLFFAMAHRGDMTYQDDVYLTDKHNAIMSYMAFTRLTVAEIDSKLCATQQL